MSVFSGEPLPVAPNFEDEVDVKELNNFHQKLLTHIRRLEIKLSGEEFQTLADISPMIRVFSGFLNADLTLTAPSGWISLDWDTEVRVDTGIFSHSTSSSQDEITILEDGFCLFLCQIGSATDAYVGGTSLLEMRLNESTKNVLDYGFSQSRIHADTLTMIVGVNVFENDVFTVDVQATTSNYTVDNAKTRLTIIYSRADTETSHGSGAGDEPSASPGFSLITTHYT